jgi:sulfur relay (sulfurtransferase) DsrF/TusC family protein
MTLIIISSPPTLDLEPIELTLALAAFDRAPTVLLLGQGIHYANLLQSEKKPNGKSPSKVVSVLPMYDCEDIYVSEKNMLEQGFIKSDLQDSCKLVGDEQIKQLINQSKHCVNF